MAKEDYISLEELKKIDSNSGNPMTPCMSCGKPTYDGRSLDEFCPDGVRLPPGITTANRRKYVQIREVRWLICTNCRYSPPFERY